MRTELQKDIMNITAIKKLTSRISCSLFNTDMAIRVERDNKDRNGRIFIQIVYKAPCTKTGIIQEWHSRKWYLSEYMTEDEVIKTTYAAFRAAVEHEVMEGFKVDNIILFNPHVDYTELLKVSHKEVKRTEMEAPMMGMSY